MAAGTTGMAAMGARPAADRHPQYRPQINPVLAMAIHVCMEPDIGRRCPTMEKFLQMVREVEHEDKI